MKIDIPIERCRELFAYDKNTGVVIRRVRTARHVQIGDVVGSNNGHGYLVVKIDGKLYRLHRIIYAMMTGKQPLYIDHINHDKSDNRWENLRSVTASENSQNRSMSSNNTSGFKGVLWSKRHEKWIAQIDSDGKHKNLGYFTDIRDAIAARAEAVKEFGYHKNSIETKVEQLEETVKHLQSQIDEITKILGTK